MREVEVNVAYRWFLGLKLRDKVPDASTLGQNRRRRFAESTIYQEIFDQIVELAISKDLASGAVLYTDSTHLKANANKNKFDVAEVKVKAAEYLETLDAAIGYLRAHVCASGYAYTIGDQSGRVAGVEMVRDQQHVTEVGSGTGPLFWHTNHGRDLPGTEIKPDGDSVRRGELLGASTPGDSEPDAGWFLRILAGATLPSGVRADPVPGHDAATVCTLVADLTSGQAVIATRGESPVAIPLPDLPAGRGTAQHVLHAGDALIACTTVRVIGVSRPIAVSIMAGTGMRAVGAA